MKSNIVSKTLNTSKGNITFFHVENDDTIFGTLSCLRDNKFHIDVIPFEDGDVVVDIGCNIGLLSIVIAKFFPGIKILAFDASPVAIECLNKTIAANGLTNIHAFNLAIGAEAKKGVHFFSNGKDISCLVADGLNKDNKVEEAVVDQISFDDIFDSPIFNVKNVRYLKMDIEGQEFFIFDHLFEQRPELLDRISYLHLEIHGYQEYNPKKLEEQVIAHFGNRVFFDT